MSTAFIYDVMSTARFAARPHAADAEQVCDDQAAVDLAFRDLEFIIAADERPVPNYDKRCRNEECPGHGRLEFGTASMGDVGSRVCSACGVVEPGPIIFEEIFGKPQAHGPYGNYRRAHHFHERISQFLLMESSIPHEQMLRIAQSICDGTCNVLNKESIRRVLRSLNLQIYIEKWLQIIFRITGIQPPCPGPLVVLQLDALFNELQQPFESQKPKNRKNFLNYNYTFNQLFQKMGCPQFCMFFPMIKSKQKLRTLDDTWKRMTETINWPAPALLAVAPFAVRLDEPAIALARLTKRLACLAAAAPSEVPLRIVLRTSGRPRPEGELRSEVPNRLKRPALEFRMRASTMRRQA
tara:strand:+ start:101 stop:1159 length:1059 start_codon:yes stop_codon:yes gene_type:complete